MANLEGIAMKYTVLKNDHIERYLSDEQKQQLQDILSTIFHGRSKFVRVGRGCADGPDYWIYAKENIYIVINTDEPYADQVIDIMKSHGHWG